MLRRSPTFTRKDPYVHLRKLLAAALLGTLALTTAPTTSPALADPQPPADQIPGGFPTWEALFAEQSKRNDAVAAIRVAADSAGDTGYGSAIADPTASATVLRWKGARKPATQAAINTQNAITPITVLTAAYTETELASEVTRIAGLSTTKFYEVEPKSDASGITVTWNPGQTDPTLAAQVIATSTVAVTFAGESIEQPRPLSRQADAPPYKAGARTDTCTAGFPINYPDGRSAMLYAAHCATSSGLPVFDSSGRKMGVIGERNVATDVATITFPATTGHIWDGGVQSNLYKSVKAVNTVGLGNLVCVSGSRSGVTCGGQVVAIGVNNGSIGPLIRFVSVDNKPMIGEGDSGAPAYTIRPDGVTAVGILSSGYGAYKTTTCTGESGRVCYKGGHFIDAQQALARVHGTIKTS
ncbi:hypothetical protein ABZ671_01545 [Micromonospora sp. NPDC006766]|uniref:hypothetical protein n=1 Tax=Micromonospora sp. NPDC006766 TaxID=3154778 RepID=UPI0033CA5016